MSDNLPKSFDINGVKYVREDLVKEEKKINVNDFALEIDGGRVLLKYGQLYILSIDQGGYLYRNGGLRGGPFPVNEEGEVATKEEYEDAE